MRHADHSLHGHDEREPVTRFVELRRLDDRIEYRVVLVGVGDRQHDLLLGLDGNPEDRLLLVHPGATAGHHGPAVRAGPHRRVQHRVAPAFTHYAHDERCTRHPPYSSWYASCAARANRVPPGTLSAPARSMPPARDRTATGRGRRWQRPGPAQGPAETCSPSVQS